MDTNDTNELDREHSMKAFDFIKTIKHVPMVMNGNKAIQASNGERRRWLLNKAVVINGLTPGPDDVIVFPITQLVFFPKSKERRCTVT